MGVTKNAVVGKAHRLQLPPRPSPIRREATPRAVALGRSATLPPVLRAPVATAVAAPPAVLPAPPVAAVPKREAPPSPPAAVPVAAVAPIVARPSVAPSHRPLPAPRSTARNCCWPIGEPGTPGFRFCTAEAMPPKPYCAEHAALAYVRVRDRREDAA